MTLQEKIDIGDKVKVGERIGEVIKIDHRPSASILKVAFEEGPARDFVSPPTKIEKILSPLERLKANIFDSPLLFDLHYESTRLSLAYAYDHLLSLSSSRTNLEPYQVEAVFKALNTYKQRIMIADDVGLGKTIEAGMILKELVLRGFVKRVLVVVPAPLRSQWHREFQDRFDENFFIYDRDFVEALKASLPKDANVWEAHQKVITSLDYAKNEKTLAELERTTWDMIIFDEAHKLSVTSDRKRSQRFRLAQTLYNKTESLLLLTATPHKGDPFAFYALLTLIDPYIFENENQIISSKLNEIIIRRGKDGINDVEGKPIFKPREVTTIPISFTSEELELYDGVTTYVQEFYNLAKSEHNRAIGFVMVLLQKRMVSSIAAISSSLKNRLSNLIKGAVPLAKEEQTRLRDYLEDPDALDDWERERFESRLEGLALPTTPEGLQKEISLLKSLLKLSEKIKVDSKGEALSSFVNGILKENPKEKILIFTEYRDTLSYIVQLLKGNGYDPLVIHGGIKMPERQETENLFKSPAFNLMVATDAAGEGINLQFCHIMVNYDLPWNPNRIDQRIGRLHRYGQKRDVKVHNLFITDTREGQILARLMQKVAIIEKDLGGKISEIVGFVLEGVNLQDLIMNAIAENRPVETTTQNIEKAIEERKSAFETIEKTFLMDLRKFDLEETLKVIENSQKRSADERDIERFVRVFFTLLEGKIEPARKRGVFRLIPPREILREGLKGRYNSVTFSKETAKAFGEEVEFMAFGHPLLEAIIDYTRDKDFRFGGRTTIKVSDKFSSPGILYNFLLSFDDARGNLIQEEIVSVFVDSNGATKIVSPKAVSSFDDISIDSYLNEVKGLSLQTKAHYEAAHEIALKEAKEICSQAQEKKDREIRIKREDTKEYFAIKIKEEEKRLNDFRSRLGLGEDMDIAIRGAEKRLDDLKKELKKVLDRLEEEELIIERSPMLLSAAVIIPGGTDGEAISQ